MALRYLKDWGHSAGYSTGVGYALDSGVRNSHNTRKDLQAGRELLKARRRRAALKGHWVAYSAFAAVVTVILGFGLLVFCQLAFAL